MLAVLPSTSRCFYREVVRQRAAKYTSAIVFPALDLRGRTGTGHFDAVATGLMNTSVVRRIGLRVEDVGEARRWVL